MERSGSIEACFSRHNLRVHYESNVNISRASPISIKIIGEIYKPDLSLLPIGSHFTMDPREATYAAKLLGSKYVIPMHYGTFPALTGTPEEFSELMKEVPETKLLVPKPGETIQ